MRYCWLNKKNNDTLIIFFCGWSFDDKPFKYLECSNNDVLVIYDYAELELPENLFDGYKEYYLITWSMGVYIAYLLRNKLPEFSKKIAINGTPFPVDDELGIPQKTFDLTPTGIIKTLDLRKPIFKQTTNYGHFGKENLPWEKIIKF